jgi:hypothetical protein
MDSNHCLEPPTLRSRTGCSVQTELQPGDSAGPIRPSSPRGTRTPDDMDEGSIALPTERETPGTGGESRTLKGVSPPGSEPSASSISATPAWWTQPGSNRHASRCKRGALPLVLWAQGPGGSNRTTAGKRHAGYSRAPLANRGHRGGIGRCGNVEETLSRSPIWRTI